MDYPLPGFPITGPATLEDWVQIDGAWHNVCYVWGSNWPAPALYVDGKPAAIRGSFALFERALSPAEIATLYQAGGER